MGKICVECEDPSWTGQTPIKAPELPADGGGVKLVDELPETGQKGMAYVLVDDLEAPTKSSGIFVYQNGWVQAGAEQTVQIVDELPETGEEGIVYWLKKSGEDAYDLYEWRNDDWLKIDTDIKLYSTTGQNVDGSMTQKATTDAIDVIKGQARLLTSADYNYPANNPQYVAIWLMPYGWYCHYYGVAVRLHNNLVSPGGTILVAPSSYSSQRNIYFFNASNGSITKFVVNSSTGVFMSQEAILTASSVVNNLTSTSVNTPLSANQGKILNDKIVAIQGQLTGLEAALNAINNGGNS